jgi:phosphoribosylanthranilate isomerase
MRVRVKFCGMTRAEDAVEAAAVGVDAIGLVFVPGSKRAVSIEQAREICSALPPLVAAVGLFLDAAAEEVGRVIDAVPLNWLQFHGREDPAFCASFARPWIKALPMGSPEAVQYSDWDNATGLMLDGHVAGAMGGSGARFDWRSARLPDRPWILAGGLDPDNVGEAVQRLRPNAVDVSSGIESAPGLKSATLMQRFMTELGRAVASGSAGRGHFS